MSDDDRQRLQAALDRIEALASALDRVADPGARAAARELLEFVLDLHGLALARALAIVTAAADGKDLVERLAADHQVRAVMLLHGLHPEPLEERVWKAVDCLRPELDNFGCRVALVEVSAAMTRLRVEGADRLGGAGALRLRRLIEAALVDAAPDLDGIMIEGLETAIERAALAAG